MKFNMGFSFNKCISFTKEIEENGYTFFSKEKNNIDNYYPNKFPNMENINISQLKESDLIEIRAFIKTGKKKKHKIESGLITAEIESIVNDEIYANILTELPPSFILQSGMTIELKIEEIIRKIN